MKKSRKKREMLPEKDQSYVRRKYTSKVSKRGVQKVVAH